MKLFVFILFPFISFGQEYSKDTTINLFEYNLLKEESLQLTKCNDILQDKNLQIYNFKEVLKKSKNEISSLTYRNAQLMKAIREHNEKLKGSQEKFKIKLTN